MSNITDYENKIAPLIKENFPDFYKEEGQNFINFVQAYYAWLELENNPLYMARRLLSYRDIDTTPEAFLLFFKNKYLNNIQFTTASNKRLFIKNSLDFYRSKGTPRAVDLFFRLIYGTNADVYLPSEDIFRLSDGDWVKPTYLEVTHTEDNLDYVGKTITGLSSGATAFVDRLVRRRVNNKYIDVFYISALSGNFETNERLTIEDDNELSNNPIVIGSLSSAEITDGSNSFSVGDTIIITSPNGLQGKGTVTEISNSSGQIDFELEEGGWGYTVNAEVIISNSVFGLTSYGNTFSQFEKINQPLANLAYSNLTGGVLASGLTIEKYFANASVAGTGKIISTTATNSTAGTLLATIDLYANGSLSNLNFSNGFSVAGNTITANTTTYTNKTASANVVGYRANSLGVANVTNTFYAGYGHIVGLTSNSYSNILTISTGNGGNVRFSSIENVEQIYLNNDLIGANNTGGVPFLNIVLDGTSSNLAANSYGFSKAPTANINSPIFNALNYTLMNVGVVASLSNINPGNSYSVSPFVVFYEKFYAGAYKLYYGTSITDLSRDFTQGEIVEQRITFANSVTLSVNNSANTWQPGEFVYQSNGTSNIATGVLQAQTVTGNVGNLVIFFVAGSTGVFVSNSTARITGATSGAQANISAVNTTLYFANAKAIVQSQANNSYLFLKRISTTDLELSGANLVGQTSGASAVITDIDFQDPPQSGLNANISANVVIANGVVSNVSIFDSGFGYIQDDEATFESEDGSRSGTLNLSLGRQGVSEGYFKSTKGFLSSDKYLWDGDFYQEFSYQIRSPLPFELYADTLKKVLHLAGTKPFGQVVAQSVTQSNVEINEPGNTISTANISFTVSLTTNTNQFSVGETVYQTNGTANIGFATVRNKLSAVIQIATTNVNFIPGQTLQQPNATSNASFSYVQAITANSTVTNVYVINATATFNATANVFGPNKYVLAVLPKVRMRFGTVTNPANSTMSFAVGENIYQGTVGSQTANGIVLNASDTMVEIRPNSGTFANNTTMIGQTSGAQATLQSYSNTAFLASENVEVCRTILYCNANSFSNGEIVYQYRRNPNLSNISFVNTAIGLVVAKNTTTLTITNRYGTFSNNDLVYGATSLANATINNVLKLTNSTATIITANSTQANVYLIIGEWANGTSLFGNTSNTYANLTTITPNNASYAVSAVVNTLDVQLVNGFFVANSTVNTITGVTSSDTATISGLTYEQL